MEGNIYVDLVEGKWVNNKNEKSYKKRLVKNKIWDLIMFFGIWSV